LPVKEQTPPIVAKGAKRRSTRLAQAVPLVVTWLGTRGKTLTEESTTVIVNCHGCRYFSRYRLRKNSRINIQIDAGGENRVSTPAGFPARVAWVRKSRRLNGLYLIGVEFETPQNLWEFEDVPEDWGPFSSAGKKEEAVAVLTEIERLLQFADAGTYYQLLGVQADTPSSEVKRRFYHLASRFHPDHHMDQPEWTPRLLRLMDALTTAYKALSHGVTKKQYDSRLAQAAGQELSGPEQTTRGFLEKAQECLAERNFIAAILWLRRAIEVEPDSSTYRAMLGSSLAAVPEYRQEAVEQFERAIELDPTHIGAHLQYARLLETMKFPGRARPHYLRVLELDMNHGEARERLNRLDAASPRPVSRSSLLNRLTGRS
jgi:tetratricopeptide (TPR) repeat protein